MKLEKDSEPETQDHIKEEMEKLEITKVQRRWKSLQERNNSQ